MITCVVQTKPNQESRARENLLRQGFQAWCPVYERSQRHARRVDIVKKPLFPGYMFVDLDPGKGNWASINSTYGVARLLTDGCRPLELPPLFVENLTARMAADGLVEAISDGVTPGMHVKVLSGPFTDIVAIVMDLLPRDRVRLMLDFLGRSVETTMAGRNLILSD